MNNCGKLLLAAVAVLSLIISPASAGVLNGNAAALAGSTGTAPYANGTLTGTLDYAVFTAAAFNATFPASGYSPTAGELVYTYQLINDAGGDAVTSVSIGLLGNPANNVGTFTIGDDDATSSSISAAEVDWNFSSIVGGDTSFGLAFSAPTLPADSFGTVIDGGLFAFPFPVPAPGSVPIPEPATVGLAAIAIVMTRFSRRRV